MHSLKVLLSSFPLRLKDVTLRDAFLWKDTSCSASETKADKTLPEEMSYGQEILLFKKDKLFHADKYCVGSSAKGPFFVDAALFSVDEFFELDHLQLCKNCRLFSGSFFQEHAPQEHDPPRPNAPERCPLEHSFLKCSLLEYVVAKNIKENLLPLLKDFHLLDPVTLALKYQLIEDLETVFTFTSSDFMDTLSAKNEIERFWSSFSFGEKDLQVCYYETCKPSLLFKKDFSPLFKPVSLFYTRAFFKKEDKVHAFCVLPLLTASVVRETSIIAPFEKDSSAALDTALRLAVEDSFPLLKALETARLIHKNR